MNNYIMIHRLTGPAILLLLGVVALLSEAHVVHFSIFIPLLLILLGVLKLAERAALAGWESSAGTAAGAGAVPPQPGAATYGTSGAGLSIAPAHDFEHDFGRGDDREGGKL